MFECELGIIKFIEDSKRQIKLMRAFIVFEELCDNPDIEKIRLTALCADTLEAYINNPSDDNMDNLIGACNVSQEVIQYRAQKINRRDIKSIIKNRLNEVWP